MREVPTSFPGEMTVTVATTTGTTAAPTTAITEKVGIGAATIVTISEESAPRDYDHEVNTVKRPNGRWDYQEDYNKTLKGPCQLHPKSNHTMEECRVLKSIYTRRAAQDDATKKNGKRDGHDHEDEDEDQDRDPRHQYVSPTDVVHSIFGGRSPSNLSERESY